MKFSLKKLSSHSRNRLLSTTVFILLATLWVAGTGRLWVKWEAANVSASSAPKAPAVAVEKTDAEVQKAGAPSQAATATANAAEKLPGQPDADLWQAFSKARHEVQTLTEREAAMPRNGGVRYFAANPGQELTARFLDDGVRIESGRGGGWQGTVQVTGLSRGDQQAVLPASAVPTAAGTRVEYERGDVVEWYDNRAEGIEHGFTVSRDPVAKGQEGAPLQVDLKFAGLKAGKQSGGNSVQFQTAEGMPALSYSELKVWDAHGTPLKAEMQAAGDRVSILVADAGAVYPVTIDPIIATLEQKLGPETTGSGAPDDNFGFSVALAGDTAVVGMPGDDTAAGENAGSAFVFLRTGSVWNQQARLKASDAAAGDSFGRSVALSGTTAVVGAPPMMQHPAVNQPPQQGPAGSAYVFVRSGTTWTQQTILTPGNGTHLTFGNAVAVAGDSAVVGDAGASRAHVFLRTGTAWAPQSVLTALDGTLGDQFGAAVSLDGNTAAVGAPLASETGPILNGSIPTDAFCGAVYLFVRSGTAWSQQQKLLGENMYDFFGGATALLGDTVVVGVSGYDLPGAQDAGAAFVYKRSGTVWSEDGSLNPAVPLTAQASFGTSVALGADRALVGAPHTNSVYVFERSGVVVAAVQVLSPWMQKAILRAGDADGMDFFGCCVALSGDTALVGAPFDDTPGGEDAGTAFVFVHGEHLCCDPGLSPADGGWCQQDRLSAGDAAVNDFFGRPLALDGNTALAGAQGDDTAAGIDTGTVYVFVRTGTVWAQQARLMPSDAVAYDGFGRGLAIVGNTAVASSPNANALTGCAYVFVRTGAQWAQTAKLLGKGGEPGDVFGRSVSMSGTTVVVGAINDTTPAGQAAGSAYVFTGSGSKWTQQAQLLANDAAAFDFFGQSVSVFGNTALVGAMGDDLTTPGQDRGCAYVFLRVGKTWSQQAKLVPTDVANGDGVGHSVALYDNVALVSADGADLGALTNAGAAYIFGRSGATWTQRQKLIANDCAAGDGFGRIVALTDGLALVGAPSDDTVGGVDAGSASLFSESSGLWVQQTQLTANDGAAGDLFGWALALSPTTALVGADSDDGVDAYDDVARNRGGVYVFNLLDTTPPEVAVEQPLDNPLVDAETPEGFGPAGKTTGRTVKDVTATPIEFGGVVIGMQGERSFQIINEGGTTLASIKITVDGANKAEFKVVKAPAATLAAKREVAFIVTFAPTALGLRTANLRIASNDSDEDPFDIVLRGTGLPAVQPTIEPLEDKLVAVGAGAKFPATVTGLPPPKIVWKRNNVAVPNATSATLVVKASLTSTGVTNAGLYSITATNSAGSASQSAELGVVDTSSKTLILPTGGTATMVVRTAGNGLSHTWLKDGAPLTLGGRISVSANGKTLAITNLELSDDAIYSCSVSGPGGVLIGGIHRLIVIDEHPLILQPVIMPDGTVGSRYSFLIPVDSENYHKATSFGATSLPSGLTVNKTTGAISGVPKVSGFFSVVLSATNFWGTTTADTSLYIAPKASASLGCGAVGTFNGLVNRDGPLNGGFGGTLVVTTTSSGTFTGQLGLAGVKYPFSGVVKITNTGSPSAKVVVKRTAPLGPVILAFTLDEYEGVLNGTITDNAVFPYQISDLAGSALVAEHLDGKGNQAWFHSPQGIARDKAGNLYVADTNNHVIRKITPTGVVTTIAGKAGFCGSTNGSLAVALFHSPQGLALDDAENIYVADTGNQAIRKITPAGVVTTLAGSPGISGSVNGTGAAARFVCPTGIVVDSAGNLYVCDHEDHTIRKITPAGVVTTFAGKSATPGTANGAGATARFNAPQGLAIDSKGVLLVADTGNHAIRAISKTGAVTTFAGAPGVPGSADGLRANARFYGPCGVAVDAAGNVFVADTLNYTLRRINLAGIVSTVAGKVDTPGFATGIDGLARFTLIRGLVMNGKTLAMTDSGAHLVRTGTPKAAVPVGVLARRNPWGTDSYTQPKGRKANVAGPVAKTGQGSCFNPPASSLMGTHNLAFELPSPRAGNSAYPQGNGFGTMTITSTGIVTWAGFMADGSTTTCSTMLGGTYYMGINYIPLHFMLYGNTGSAQGWQEIYANFPTAASADPQPTTSIAYEVYLDGLLDWMKIPQATAVRSYAAGIPLHEQSTFGENNLPPDSGDMVLGFRSGTNNAVLRFFEGGLNPEFSQVFTITPTNTVSMPPVGTNNPKDVKLTTFSASTSKFAGTFVLKETNPIMGGTPAEITRTPTTFNGVLLRRLGHGVGYSLIGEAPSAGPPVTTVTTSPINSGQVILEQNREE